jgi:hypothetical protein
VWAVGDGGTAIFYDGVAWSPLSPPTAENLRAVWAAGPDDVWVAGDNGLLLNYDGAGWNPAPIAPAEHLLDIWGVSGEDLYVSGNNSRLLHYDGGSWKNEFVTPLSLTFHRVFGLDTTEVYIAAELLPGATVAHGGGWVFRYDGTTWSEVYSDPTQDIWAIWAGGADDVWVSGDFGSIVHYDGAGWKPVWRAFSNTGSLLDALWGAASGEVYIAGASGTLLRYSR